jgi:hypothetical protein
MNGLIDPSYVQERRPSGNVYTFHFPVALDRKIRVPSRQSALEIITACSQVNQDHKLEEK